jgi:hypothetical protein
MDTNEREQLERLARKFGPPNCWTGSTGTLAAALLHCLKTIEKLTEGKKQNDGRVDSV